MVARFCAAVLRGLNGELPIVVIPGARGQTAGGKIGWVRGLDLESLTGFDQFQLSIFVEKKCYSDRWPFS